MEYWDNLIYWDKYYNTIIIFNLLIVIGLFTALRLFSGTIAHINASDELLKKDNPAFGISLAGATFAVTIMLSGTMYGTEDGDIFSSLISIGGFGILGIILMAITRIIFDKITLPRISLRNEIVKGNVAVAIADTGNVIAAAIIIRAIMIWVPVYSLEGVVAILGGYAISQVLMTVMTILRIRLFKALNKDNCLQEELRNGNSALALRFAGQKIGIAFSIAMAAQIVVYEEYDLLPILGAWFFASLIVIMVWKILCVIAQAVILYGVDINKEVLEQKNIAVGALQAVIYISLGLLISTV